MPIEEYVASPLVSVANRFIAERYLKLSGGLNQRNFGADDFVNHPVGPDAPTSNFGIVQTPVPSYDGRNTNMCYSVGSVDLS
jgi:hypothetical protein